MGVHTEALASCIGRADAEEQLTLISWLELQTSGDIEIFSKVRTGTLNLEPDRIGTSE